MKHLITTLCCTFAIATNVLAFSFGEDVFKPTVSYADGIVTVEFNMSDDPAKHIYDESLSCTLGDPLSAPAKDHVDETGQVMYEGVATFTYASPVGKVFTISYQGCDADTCHFPQNTVFTVMPDGTVVEGEQELPALSTTQVALIVEVKEEPIPQDVSPETSVDFPAATRTKVGYHDAEAFLEFLQKKGKEEVTFESDATQYAKEHGILWVIILIFFGGFALNLTPCVLPMIPINLAIIGAGAAGGSRMQGAIRGGAYGLGTALAYGSLGILAALTGTAFGAIQSTWWFNIAIAVIFIALALALFDVFMIDFTRFSQGGNSKQGTIAAFIAGVMSAILAGACVAPVLIAVLLLTSSYVAEGAYWALSLPFILGLGMALPWPFAGAGLSFLPRPGAWMAWVKKIFGVVVIGFAIYYGYNAWKVLVPETSTTSEQEQTEQSGVQSFDAKDADAIAIAINTALKDGKTVFLDFYGPVCKACDKMDATTLKDPKVKAELDKMEFFKIRTDLADGEGIARICNAYGISGVPMYVVIEPTTK